MNFSKTLFGQTIESVGWLIFIISLGLFLDSSFFANNYYEHGQQINTLLVVLVYSYLYWKGTSRVRQQLVYAFLIGLVGEYIFSIALGMYTYRLENIPHYIPFGHAVVFTGVYFFSRKQKVKFFRKQLELFFTISIAIYSLFLLVFKNDIFGFSLTILVFLSLRKYPKERLFYLSMFFIIGFIEVLGTSLGCWEWPSIAFGKFEFLPSSNPPSGICFFYYGLDRGTLSIYKRRNKAAWNRFKQMRSLKF